MRGLRRSQVCAARSTSRGTKPLRPPTSTTASELSPSNAPELPTELAFLSLFSSSDSEDDDDLEALFPAPTQLSSREERIQRAIDSGKKAYGADQAFTPFGWYADKRIVSKRVQEPKALLRTREHLAEAHYVNGRYRDSLDLCMSLLPEPYDTNVNREVIDISLRCCLRLEDRAVGERLARGCRSMWLSSPSLAMSSGQVLAMCGVYKESLKAFLCALSARSAQQPYAHALAASLALWSRSSGPTSSSISLLHADVAHFASLSEPHFSRALFGPPMTRTEGLPPSSGKEGQHDFMDAPKVDGIADELELDSRTRARLHQVWTTMRGSSGTGAAGALEDEDEEKGVRGL